MKKMFRCAFLACGLVGYALSAAATPAIPVRVATVERAAHVDERQIPDASRRFTRSRSAPVPKAPSSSATSRTASTSGRATASLPSMMPSRAPRWRWPRPS
ncbi:Uncharacterised protein [Raoultella terrigena]|uniref:Uncharacterized protein n=1 Tax=Raoultella terrigena TaxID=577 RepID=A0A4U9D891_RAOTE|nr:Uncharacterised protein [Raoultella terrigena]